MKIHENKTKEQNLVLSKWKENNYKGSWIAATSCGKTRVGVIAAGEFIRRNNNETSLVIVPTENLRDNEWKNQFVTWGYVRELEKVQIECIQTVYKWVGKHFNTVVIDESHWSIQGAKYSDFLKNNTYDRILCLTATPPDDKIILQFMQSVAPIIHTTNTQRALELGLISPFIIYNIPVEFTSEEQKSYNQINSNYSFYERQLGGQYVAFTNASKYLRFKNIGKSGENICVFTPENRVIYRSEINGINISSEYTRSLTDLELSQFRDKIEYSSKFWRCMRERKNLCYNAFNKISLVKQILDKFPERRSIVFSESVKTANEIAQAVGNECIVFHSKMSQNDRKTSLSEFSSGSKRIISAVKALNEGMDVPECSLGICHSGTGKLRPSIQRRGRSLRLVEGKIALYINIYVKNTQEEKWVKSRDKDVKDNVHWIESINDLKI